MPRPWRFGRRFKSCGRLRLADRKETGEFASQRYEDSPVPAPTPIQTFDPCAEIDFSHAAHTLCRGRHLAVVRLRPDRSLQSRLTARLSRLASRSIFGRSRATPSWLASSLRPETLRNHAQRPSEPWGTTRSSSPASPVTVSIAARWASRTLTAVLSVSVVPR
jgi:hypothetical protein